MELRQIRYVLAVARSGAVRRAAVALGVDQMSVHQKIKDLEAELGVQLFERHAGGARVTPAGEVFIAGIAPALRALDAAAAQVKGLAAGVAPDPDAPCPICARSRAENESSALMRLLDMLADP